ncbi:serine/threonine-protein kinase [Myxococcota bacterium]
MAVYCKTQMPPAVPKIIVAQRYELQETVGQGGYGVVFRALDLKTQRSVAVKVLAANAFNQPHVLERLIREQQAMQALAGTAAVNVIDLCTSPSGAPCLVMEWLDGIDLDRHLTALEQAGQRLSVDALLVILAPVVETLARAHQLGIVHRDLKPANIFLHTRPPAGVRLLDFGLARTKSCAPLTAAGMVLGSPAYIAPEVWTGNSRAVDHRADLYSLAVIAFRSLTGRVPFPADSLLEIRELAMTAQRPSLHAHRPDLPRGMDDWMQQALAADPGHRFNTAQGMFTALVQTLGEEPAIPAALPDPPFPSPSPRPAPGNNRTSETPGRGPALTSDPPSARAGPREPVTVSAQLLLDESDAQELAADSQHGSTEEPLAHEPHGRGATPSQASGSKRSKKKRRAKKRPQPKQANASQPNCYRRSRGS